MAEEETRAEVHVPRAGQMEALPAAIGMHIGLGIVCASAIYTPWQKSIITYPQWAVMLLVAGALLVAGLSRWRGVARRTWARLTLASAGLLVFRLCYDPQLGSVPRLAEELPESFLSTYPSIALIGIAVALVSWFLYTGAGGELDLGVIPFRRSVLGATGLAIAFSLVAYFLLARSHELPLSEMLRPVLTVAQGGALLFVLLGIGGGPGVRRAPHLYFAITLIAAFARNMAFPME